jgi:hypothetical protein
MSGGPEDLLALPGPRVRCRAGTPGACGRTWRRRSDSRARPRPRPPDVSACYLPDGTLACGQIHFQLPQLVLTAGGGAVEVGNPVRCRAPATYVVLNRPPAAVRICLSGAGS